MFFPAGLSPIRFTGQALGELPGGRENAPLENITNTLGVLQALRVAACL